MAYLQTPTVCCIMGKCCPAPSHCCSMVLTKEVYLSWHPSSLPQPSPQAHLPCCQVQSMSCLRAGRRRGQAWPRALHLGWLQLGLEVTFRPLHPDCMLYCTLLPKLACPMHFRINALPCTTWLHCPSRINIWVHHVNASLCPRCAINLLVTSSSDWRLT